MVSNWHTGGSSAGSVRSAVISISSQNNIVDKRAEYFFEMKNANLACCFRQDISTKTSLVIIVFCTHFSFNKKYLNQTILICKVGGCRYQMFIMEIEGTRKRVTYYHMLSFLTAMSPLSAESQASNEIVCHSNKNSDDVTMIGILGL